MPQRTLQLIVAEGCNLRCAYCFEHYKRHRTMEFPVAREAVNYYLSVNDECNEVMIDFMGGEPMLAFPLIKQVVEYIRAHKWPKHYHFSMSTNGTLFDNDNKPWFLEYKRVFTPMLSLDGTKLAHDMNRSGSYDHIMLNIDFFRDNWPFQSLRMTVDNRSLPYLSDGVLSIHTLGFPVDLNLVNEDVWGEGETKRQYMKILEYELARLVDFYSEQYLREVPQFVNLPVENCVPIDRDSYKSWCGAGTAMVAIGIDGTHYPCHRFLEFSSGKSLTLDEFNKLNHTIELESPCLDCLFLAACPTCQACNWEYTGSLTMRTTYKCELLKLQMVASAAIQVNRINKLFLHRGPKDIKDQDLALIKLRLDGAKLVFQKLKDIPQAELKPYVEGIWPNGLGWEKRVRWFERHIN